MSPLQIPPDYANFKVTLTNADGGISGRSTVALAFHLVAPLIGTDVSRIANLLRDGLTPRYDNSWLLGPVRATENAAGILKVWEDTGTEAGTHAAGSYAPPGVALVISKRTGILGRAHRGRLFMPGVEETLINEGGIITGSEVNAWQASIDALQTALIADASIDSIALLHDVSSPFANDPDIVQNFLVRNVVGGMRPRQRR